MKNRPRLLLFFRGAGPVIAVVMAVFLHPVWEARAARDDGGANRMTADELVLAQPASQPADSAGDDDSSEQQVRRALTPEEINRIRYMELRAMRTTDSRPDSVSVKITKDAIDEFLLSMEGHEDFRGDRPKREFLKMTSPQKLHVIARYKGAAFADKVRIKSDPEVFTEFRKNVLPLVLHSCATSGCHTSTNRDAPGFFLINDPKRTDQAVYSDFLILNDLRLEHHRIIDRSQPEHSLLLMYLLPRSEVRVELRHPGDVDYPPAFQSRKHARYNRILRWIESLKHPAEDYGVHLIKQPPLPEEPDADSDSGSTTKPSND